MSYKLLALPISEVRMYYRVCREAFIPGILEVLYPGGYTDKNMEHGSKGAERNYANYPGRYHFFKVVDTNLPESDPFDKVVGVSQWHIFPRERTEEEMQREKELSDRDEAEYGDSPGIAEQVSEDFGAAIKAKKDKFMGRKPYVLCAVLATRPEYERRGVGSVSMAWGTKKADELGLPMWLEGSPKGVPLYKKWGFEVVDQLDFDATKYGYSDALTHMCMLRPAVKARMPIPQS